MKILAQIFYFILGFGLVITMFALGAISLDWVGLSPDLDPNWINQYPVLNYILIIIFVGGSAVFQLFGHALDPKFHIRNQFNHYKLPVFVGVCTACILIFSLFLISFLGSKAGA